MTSVSQCHESTAKALTYWVARVFRFLGIARNSISGFRKSVMDAHAGFLIVNYYIKRKENNYGTFFERWIRSVEPNYCAERSHSGIEVNLVGGREVWALPAAPQIGPENNRMARLGYFTIYRNAT